MNSKRQSPRSRRRLQIQLENGRLLFTADISPGGIGLAMAQPLQPGAVVSGKIRVDNELLPFVGKVAWAVGGDPRLGLLARVGIRFTGVAKSYVERCFTARAA